MGLGDGSRGVMRKGASGESTLDFAGGAAYEGQINGFPGSGH